MAPTEVVSTVPFSVQDRQDLVDAARAVAESGLVVGSSGNLSLRRDDHLLITPRGARLAAIDPADLVPVALATGDTHAEHTATRDSQASSELQLHRAAYAGAPAAGAVVHTHSAFATVLSTLVAELPAIHYVAASFGGPVRVAPYATFGSRELADGVAAALDGRSAALMANHGAVVTGSTIGHAVEQSLQLEWLASVYWHARVFGTPAVLDGEQLDAVTAQSRALRYAITEGGA